MLSVAEAQTLVLQRARALPVEATSVAAEAFGRVLAEDVTSDLDMPPFDKALMDGYAVRSSDLPQGRGTLLVVDEITAGQTPRMPVAAGQAIRIMTGAPLPAGADAVVVVEATRPLDGNRVQIEDRPLQPGANILRRGREMQSGERVLRAGAVLRPQEFGLLGSVGRTAVKVYPRPHVAILSTGDELVDPAGTPAAGQIRNGNSLMLLAQVCRAGGIPLNLGIARDRLESLQPLIQQGLEAAVLVLSGGVSAGKLDLVPGVLADLGVEAHFHKVAMKPGKPVFFGTRGQTLVFGLPGNPVSSLVCFELFVRPALRRLQGYTEAGPYFVQATLSEDFPYRTDRPTYYPARLEETAEGRRVRPVAWFGSADLRSLTQANAFLLLPVGDHRHCGGQQFPVLKVEED
jgi:molybdopterin molybdotransferase